MQLDLFKDVEEKIDWKDPVQVREYHREYRINNKEKRREYYLNNKEKRREYYQNNKEKIRESNREYCLNNKEKIREINREYRINNKEKRREYCLNNKEKIREINREYRINNKEKLREYYLNNKEKRRESNREYYLNNKEKLREINREYYLNNKEKLRECRLNNKEKIREYYLNNKEIIRERARKWAKNNRAAVNQQSAKRRAMKIRAIPEWLKNCPIEKKRISHPFKLAKIYEKMDGIKRNVDHMWPLIDGGPHWSGNLEVLTATENNSKRTYSCPKLKKQIKLNLKEAEILKHKETICYNQSEAQLTDGSGLHLTDRMIT